MTDQAASNEAGVKRLRQLAQAPEFLARYRLAEMLGIGGSGVVFAAHQTGVERTVAVKFLMRLEADDLARFMREAKMLGSLRHPHVTQVFELGELEGHPYLVTEYLAGGSLKDRMKTSIDLAEAVGLALEMLSGLQACHEMGFIHRDVKPGNILFSAEGRAKVADLGLARDTGGASMTVTGSLVGTPRYMAPEQVRGEPATAASDVYAMGLVLYEMFGGGYPFRADTLPGLLLMQVQQDPPPLKDVVPGMPESVSLAVQHAMAKNAAGRPQTAQALHDELRSAAAAASLVSFGGTMIVQQPLPPPSDPAEPGARPRRTGLSPAATSDVAKQKRTVVVAPANERPERPDRPDRAAARRRVTAAVIAVAAVAGLLAGTAVLLITRSGGAGERVLAEPPMARAASMAARISWRTAHPTRTSVIVWPEGGRQSEGRTASAPAEHDASTQDHALVIAGLAPSRSYRYRVVFEEGKLSADSFSFSTRPEPDLVADVTARPVSPTHARVAWRRRGAFTPGVRTVGRDGKTAQYHWPEPSGEPDAVRVPIATDALNKLEICFRELEIPPPPADTPPDRIPLPPLLGPERAKTWTAAMLKTLRDTELRSLARELVVTPHRLFPALRKPYTRPGRELVEKLTDRERVQVLDEVKKNARRWLRGRYADHADGELRLLPGGPDIDQLLAGVAAWMADPSFPDTDRDLFREKLVRLAALDSVGQLTAGEDVLGIDQLAAARVRVERRAGLPKRQFGGDSLIDPLELPRELPVPVPVGVWGDQQLEWMSAMNMRDGGAVDLLKRVVDTLALPERPEDDYAGRWYRLADLPATAKPSAGMRVSIVVTNLDPSMRLTLRFGARRNVTVRNTLAAHTGYVSLITGFSRQSLERQATHLIVTIAPGVIEESDRKVALNLDAYTAENQQGTFSAPPLVWFHEIAVAQGDSSN